MRAFAPLALCLLAACEDVDFVPPEEEAPLSLTVGAPAYGEFLGDRAAVVTGTVTPVSAQVLVEGAAPDARAGNAFRAEVPMDGPWNVITVEAFLGDAYLRERIPVFRGHDPADTWPGALPARLLAAGLDALGGAIGPLLDAAGWADALSTSLPAVDLGWLLLSPAGLTHAATESTLAPAEDGVALVLSLRDLTIAYEATLDLFGYTVSTPLSLAYGTVTLSAIAVPAIDGDGLLTLSIGDAALDLADPDVTAGSLDATLLEWVLDALDSYVSEPLAELLLGVVTDALGTLDLGGPYGFETDLLGTTLDLDLRDVHGDLDGLALGLAAGIGTPSPDSMPGVPYPREADAPGAQAAVGLHEYVLDLTLSDQVLGMLDQDLDLGGMFGTFIGAFVEALPGGGDAPEGDGWCLTLDPGSAHVVRLQEGLDPLAVLHVPDLRMEIGVADGSGCDDWLEASLAVDVGVVVREGTALGVDLDVVEGAVLAYGAEPGWDEQEVVDGLASMIESVLGLLGGTIEIDLGDLLGGAVDLSAWGFPPLSPALTGSVPLCHEDGACPEGLYAVSMDLFADSRIEP